VKAPTPSTLSAGRTAFRPAADGPDRRAAGHGDHARDGPAGARGDLAAVAADLNERLVACFMAAAYQACMSRVLVFSLACSLLALPVSAQSDDAAYCAKLGDLAAKYTGSAGGNGGTRPDFTTTEAIADCRKAHRGRNSRPREEAAQQRLYPAHALVRLPVKWNRGAVSI